MANSVILDSASAVDTAKPGEATRNAILDAAEMLFAEHGLDSVSLRIIVAHAKANVAAVNYHFGSKNNLIEHVFARRAKRIASERLRRLKALPKEKNRVKRVENIIRAFLEPGLLGGADTIEGAATFAKLRARLTTETSKLGRRLLAKYFDESSASFLEAFKEALPNESERELQWRFHAMLGVMVYTMADPGRIQSLTNNACDPSDLPSALPHLVALITNIFCAPPTKISYQSV